MYLYVLYHSSRVVRIVASSQWYLTELCSSLQLNNMYQTLLLINSTIYITYLFICILIRFFLAAACSDPGIILNPSPPLVPTDDNIERGEQNEETRG